MGFVSQLSWNNQHLRDAIFSKHFGIILEMVFQVRFPKTNNRKKHGKTRKTPPLEDVSPTKKGYFPLPC